MGDEINNELTEVTKKSKKGLWIFISLLVVVIIILLVYFLILKTPKEINKCIESGETDLQIHNCIQEQARITQNIAICDFFEVDFEFNNNWPSKFGCIQSIKKDVNICYKEKGLDKDSCLNNAVRYIPNVEICSEIGSGIIKENCLRYVGVLKNDPSICVNHTFCILDIALNNSNEEMCRDYLSSELGSERCLSEFYIRKRNPSGCYNVIETVANLRTNCFSELAAILKNKSLCSEAYNSYKDSCTYGESLCLKSSNSIKNNCIKEVAISLNNANICEEIVYEEDYVLETKDECYYHIALNTSNNEICNKIQSSDTENICNALTQKDESFCYKVDDEIDKFNCVFYVAKETEDKSVCNNLPENTDLGYYNKSHCFAMVDYITKSHKTKATY